VRVGSFLRASQNFVGSESCRPSRDRAPHARQNDNGGVLTCNNAVTTVPRGIFAAIFRFWTRVYL
jgi:hypothetical protein